MASIASDILRGLVGAGTGYLNARQAKEETKRKTEQQKIENEQNQKRIEILEADKIRADQQFNLIKEYQQYRQELERDKFQAGEADLGAQTVPTPGMGTMEVPGQPLQFDVGGRRLNVKPTRNNLNDLAPFLQAIKPPAPKVNFGGINQASQHQFMLDNPDLFRNYTEPPQKADLTPNEIRTRVLTGAPKKNFGEPIEDFNKETEDYYSKARQMFPDVDFGGGGTATTTKFNPSKLTGKAKSEYAKAVKSKNQAVLDYLNGLSQEQAVKELSE